jgi:hypothetical protein
MYSRNSLGIVYNYNTVQVIYINRLSASAALTLFMLFLISVQVRELIGLFKIHIVVFSMPILKPGCLATLRRYDQKSCCSAS